jgi:hypothetical protein
VDSVLPASPAAPSSAVPPAYPACMAGQVTIDFATVWARAGPDAKQPAVRNLRDDLASGRWAGRNRDIVDLDAAELALRLLIA